MSEPLVHEIDPSDEPALRDWWAIGALASAERPLDPWPSWEKACDALSTRSDLDKILLLASLDGAVVGAAVGYLFLLDNTHLVEVRVHVDPSTAAAASAEPWPSRSRSGPGRPGGGRW